MECRAKKRTGEEYLVSFKVAIIKGKGKEREREGGNEVGGTMRLSFGKETMVLVEVSVCTEDGLHGRRYVFALVLPLACTQSPNPRVDLHALFDVNGKPRHG